MKLIYESHNEWWNSDGSWGTMSSYEEFEVPDDFDLAAAWTEAVEAISGENTLVFLAAPVIDGCALPSAPCALEYRRASPQQRQQAEA